MLISTAQSNHPSSNFMLEQPQHQSTQQSRQIRKGNRLVGDLSSTNGFLITLSDDDEASELAIARNRDIKLIHSIPNDIELSSEDEDEKEIETTTRRAFHQSQQIIIPVGSQARNGNTTPTQLSRKRGGSKIPIKTPLPNFNRAIITNTIPRDIKSSSEKDLEIKELKQRIQDMLETQALKFNDTTDGIEGTGALPTDDMRSAKIKELSRKLRRLTVAFEKERSLVSTLNAQVKKLEAANAPVNSIPASQVEERLERTRAELKTLKEKMSIALRKMEEERMHNQTLKLEIRNLHKVLIQEVGEGSSVEKLLKGESNAKGRVEQISILKDKIKDLKRKMQSNSSNTNLGISLPNIVPDHSAAAAADHNGIYKAELGRRKEYEKVQQELDQAKQELIEIRKKNEGLAARAKILDNANRESKSKMQVILRKGANDDQLIVALQEELKRYQSSVGQKDSEKAKQVLELQKKEIETLKTSISDLEKKRDTLQNYPQEISDYPTYNELDEGEGHGSAKLKVIFESLQKELSQLRKSKLSVEAQLIEEKKNSQFLRLKLNRDENKPTIKVMATKKSEVIEELKDTIGILSDENDALKLSIKLSSETKASDLEMYQKLLDQTRKDLEE